MSQAIAVREVSQNGAGSGVNEVIITKEQRGKIEDLLPLFQTNDESSLLNSSHVFGFILENIICSNPESKQKIEEFKNLKNHILVIRNFPVEKNLPATPYTGYCSLESLPLSVSISFGMMNLLNVCPVTYKGENDNRIVRHVAPSVSAVSDISSHGSKIAFGMHVDNPDLPLVTEPIDKLSGCPEYLSLHSLRFNPNVPTKVMLLDDVIKNLSADVIEELQKPQFRVKRPDSFVGMNVEGDSLPVLSKDESLEFISRYDKENVLGKNEKANEALKAFQDAIDNSDKINEFILQPGDYVIFRNQKTLHARDGFVPEFNGLDRWMIRMFGLKDLSRGVPVKNNIPYVLEA